MRKRAELFAYTQNTASKYNLQVPLDRIASLQNWEALLERFDDPAVTMSIAANLEESNGKKTVPAVKKKSAGI